METNHQNKKSGLGRGCLLFFIIFALVPLCAYLSLLGMGSYLVDSDSSQPADAIAVLSGEEGARVVQAVEIFKREKFRYFVFTRTDQEDIGENRTYSESLMRIAIEMNVAQDSMLVTEGEALSTVDEAKVLLLLAQKRGIQSYLVVTDPYHTRRTRVIFETVFAESGIDVAVLGVEDHWYEPDTWMFKLTGWKVTLAEYFGLIAFSLES